MQWEVIAPVVTQLGVGAIFVYLFIEERKNARLDRQEAAKKLEEAQQLAAQQLQNVQLQTLQERKDTTDKVMEVVNKNTEAMVRNAEAAKTLTEAVRDVLNSNR